MSARRRIRIAKSKNKTRKYGLLIRVLIPLMLVGGLFGYLKFTTKHWDGANKAAFVFQNTSGDVGVTVLDPALDEKTTLIIPGDTEITVARGYGTLRLKNVWQLGLNEKIKGALLAQTVTNNFLFPASLWSETNLDNPWQFLFNPGLTNVAFGDRLAMVLFSLSVKSIDTTQINLAEKQFLKKQTLTDGQSGYVINGPVSGRLTVYFSDNGFVAKNPNFALIDATETPGVGNRVGAILEVLGGKVVSLEKRPADAELDCRVYGKDSEVVRKMAILFACEKTSDKSDFDLVIVMGGKFSRRF